MLNIYVQTKVTSKGTLLEYRIVFYEVECYFSSFLRLLWLLQVICLHSCSTFHLDKEWCNQVPSSFEIIMSNWNVEFPIINFMWKLILSMPVHSTQLSVQFDESIITDCLIPICFWNFVSIFLEKFIGETLIDINFIFWLKFLNSCISLLLLHSLL